MAAIHRGQKVRRVGSSRAESKLEASRSGWMQDFQGSKSWERSVRSVEDCGSKGMEAQHVHRIQEIRLGWWQITIEFFISFFKVF